METIDYNNTTEQELNSMLENLDAERDFKLVLEWARAFSDNAQILQSNLACKWILNTKPDFVPALVHLSSNLLRTQEFKALVNLLRDQIDNLPANDKQEELLRYMLAKAELETDNPSNAAVLILDNIIERENKPTWYNIVEIDILAKIGDRDKLINLLDEKIAFYRDFSIYIDRKLNVLQNSGDRKRAYAQVLEALQINPSDINLLHHKARFDIDALNLLDAKVALSKILDLRDDDFKAHLFLGRLYFLEDDFQLMDYHFERAIKYAKEDHEKFLFINVLVEIEKDDLADKLIEKWFLVESPDPEALLHLSQIMQKRFKLKRAYEYIKQAISIKSEKRYFLELAKIYSSLKDYDQAESEIVLNGLMEDPKIAYYARLEYAMIPKRRGRLVEALQRFKDFAVFYPDRFEVKVEIVALYQQLSMFTEAYQLLKNEVAEQPANVEAWLALIECYYLNQNYFGGLSTIEKYLQQFGDDEKVLNFQSACLREVGQFEACEKKTKAALSIYPNSFNIKISLAHLYRRLSSEYFFEKAKYNELALKTHESITPAFAYQRRILDAEIINDLMHLSKYSAAIEKIDESLAQRPDQADLHQQRVRILSKMGSHKRAYDYIKNLPANIQEDHKMQIHLASELLYLDRWDECAQVISDLINLEKSPEAYVLLVKLKLRQGLFDESLSYFHELLNLSPHHAFIHNELIDFALSYKSTFWALRNKLGVFVNGPSSLLEPLSPDKVEVGEDGLSVIYFGSNIAVSHLKLSTQKERLKEIFISKDLNSFELITDLSSEIRSNGPDLWIEGTFDIKAVRLPSELLSSVRLYTIYPLPTDGSTCNTLDQSLREYSFTTNIVETGLGDQLHYIRTAALIGESLGMKFEGFLKSEFEIVRDRVTEDIRLYGDLGFSDHSIFEEDYKIIRVSLNLKTRLVPATYQWSSFKQFLDYVKGLIEDAIAAHTRTENKKTLIYLSVDDHNFTRLFAKLYYPCHEPRTKTIKALSETFQKRKREREIGALPDDDKIMILLQCRLGDVANIPFEYNGEKVWVVPFSGELMKDNVSNKHHMRYSNLEKVKKIGQCIKNEFGEAIQLKLITDGYDYGIDYLKEYQQILIDELGTSNNELDKLKHKLATSFHEEFSFVDEIVYGEDYDKLIDSIDLVTTSNVLISTNGQFTNEFKMSFSLDEENYLIVKKLYSNLRVSRSIHSTEMFWELDGIDEDKMLQRIMHYIQSRL